MSGIYVYFPFYPPPQEEGNISFKNWGVKYEEGEKKRMGKRRNEKKGGKKREKINKGKNYGGKI